MQGGAVRMFHGGAVVLLFFFHAFSVDEQMACIGTHVLLLVTSVVEVVTPFAIGVVDAGGRAGRWH